MYTLTRGREAVERQSREEKIQSCNSNAAILIVFQIYVVESPTACDTTMYYVVLLVIVVLFLVYSSTILSILHIM